MALKSAEKKHSVVQEPTPTDTVEEFLAQTAPPADWFADEHYDGQLAVDVYQAPEGIVIKSAIAGVEPEDLDIAVHRDVVTIRGRRKRQDEVSKDQYLFQECYWGSFSRTVILPFDIDTDRVSAALKSGILRVVLPRAKTDSSRLVRVKSEDDTE